MKYIKFKVVIKMVLYIMGLISFLHNENAIAQNEEEGSNISVELNFISDAIFMGRKDSVTAPYVYPSLMYHHKSGFYAAGSFSYLTKPDDNRIDLFLLSSGFDFQIKKLKGDLSVTKYFFNDESSNVISDVTADITAGLIYDLNVINMEMSASSYFNKNSSSDFFLTLGMSHDFLISGNKFQVSPGLEVNLGSQNFYQEYYKKIVKGSGSGNMSGTPMNTETEITVQEYEEFKVLSIEFAIPVWYNYKAASFVFMPVFVAPQSEADLLNGEILVKEKLEETFYWMIGMSYKF